MNLAESVARFFKKTSNKKINADIQRLPVHIAIIPDGNGRWAQKRGLPRKAGHREGARVIRELTRYCTELGIAYLTIYAFSTENWTRPDDEVTTLMGMILEFMRNAEEEVRGMNVRIRVIGSRSGLSPELDKEIGRVETLTLNNTGLSLNIALNYGGRDEIINAVRKISEKVRSGAINYEDINLSLFESNLYTGGIPDPDLLIRTGAEKRVSNFLLWQIAYTEMLFLDILWPDFDKKAFIDAVTDYSFRKRRFGTV